MTPRLALERDAVDALLTRTRRARLLQTTPDGLVYIVAFDVRTLVSEADGSVRPTERWVPVAYELSPLHPVETPVAIALQGDLFNPHVHDPRRPSQIPPLAFVCLGTFRVERRLADYILLTYQLLAFQRITPKHGLNPIALDWSRRAYGDGTLPIDPRPFFEPLRPETQP